MKKMRMNKENLVDLVSEMTIGEKVGQLNQFGASIYEKTDDAGIEKLIEDGKVGSLLFVKDVATLNKWQKIAVEKSRLHIPLLFANDIVHGVRTIFPTPLAESCSWEPDLARKTAELSALEGSALGYKWTYAPMVDVVRDSRWGRVMESFGEDTYLTSLFAQAKVEGFQGTEDKIDLNHMAACAKHFVAYGVAEAGKEYNTVSLSDWNLHNVYLPPFKACVDKNVASFMTAFNDLNGVPCTVNEMLLQDILRKSWKFNGVVVSDFGSLVETIAHGYSADESDAACLGVKNQLNIDMCSDVYVHAIENLVCSGVVSEQEIDKLVLAVLELKMRLGLFENPYTDEQREKQDLYKKETLQVALESAEKSIVLLKNDGVLPLGKDKKILVLGELANSRRELHGNWAADGTAEHTKTILESLTELFDVDYIAGFGIRNFDKKALSNTAVNWAKYDSIIVVAGESFIESGEAAAKTNISLSDAQKAALSFILQKKVPTVLLLVNGRPLVLGKEIAEQCSAIVECWQLGIMASPAITNVISGRVVPEGKLTMSFPRATGQCPIYYNHFSTGRPYRSDDKFTSRYIDCEEGAMYPFGYGLSYTHFTYSDASCKKENDENKYVIYVTVENDGDHDGVETVQLYYNVKPSKPIRPVQELLRFKKIKLKSKTKEVIQFTISESDLNIDKSTNPKITFYVGGNSKDALEIKM